MVSSDYNFKMLSVGKKKKDVCDEAVKLAFLLIFSFYDQLGE